MIVSQTYSIVIVDLFCNETTRPVNADIIRYNEWSTPTLGYAYPPFHTILLDLNKSEADLLAAMEADTRYCIRRASKDAYFGEFLEGVEGKHAVPEFCDFYDLCAAVKGLAPIARRPLTLLADSGSLVLSRVCRESTPLVYHAYYRDKVHALQLYSIGSQRLSSCSSHRQLVGRANRFLHWKDILWFKQNGLSTLDFGGWHEGSDHELVKINKFKEDFGGTVVSVHNGMEGITTKGKLAVWFLQHKALYKQRWMCWSAAGC